jgi:hypothetical protein
MIPARSANLAYSVRLPDIRSKSERCSSVQVRAEQVRLVTSTISAARAETPVESYLNMQLDTSYLWILIRTSHLRCGQRNMYILRWPGPFVLTPSQLCTASACRRCPDRQTHSCALRQDVPSGSPIAEANWVRRNPVLAVRARL